MSPVVRQWSQVPLHHSQPEHDTNSPRFHVSMQQMKLCALPALCFSSPSRPSVACACPAPAGSSEGSLFWILTVVRRGQDGRDLDAAWQLVGGGPVLCKGGLKSSPAKVG